MDITLREGDRDFGFSEQSIDSQTRRAFGTSSVHFGSQVNPEMGFEMQRVVAKIGEQNDRFPMGKHLGNVFDRLTQKYKHAIGWRTVATSMGRPGTDGASRSPQWAAASRSVLRAR